MLYIHTLLLLFSCSVMSNSLRPHSMPGFLPCPSLSPWVWSKSRPLSQWCHPTISSSVVPFSFRSGLPCLSPENLPNPRIKPRSSTLQADSLPAEPQGKAGLYPWPLQKCVPTFRFSLILPLAELMSFSIPRFSWDSCLLLLSLVLWATQMLSHP